MMVAPDTYRVLVVDENPSVIRVSDDGKRMFAFFLSDIEVERTEERELGFQVARISVPDWLACRKGLA
ncbi:hypothetical protein [Hyphomonas sp.]|uniref:hypothetical protein n=1 Tax=Hyphomonas sp. TaxID=87 RepID=UPI0025BD9431|nr:hypothetical protein [Hyphomonas sp.]